MAQQIVNIGTIPGDGTGDHLYVGGDKINDNFTELYAAVALNTAKVTNATHTGDATGSGALTLATVNASPGTYTNATVTVNAKGLVTSASSGSVASTALKYSKSFSLNAGLATSCVTTLASTVVPYSIMLEETIGGKVKIVTQNYDIERTTSGAFLSYNIYSSDNVTVTLYLVY